MMIAPANASSLDATHCWDGRCYPTYNSSGTCTENEACYVGDNSEALHWIPSDFYKTSYGLGRSSTGTYELVIRFDEADLTPYETHYMTHFSFDLIEASAAESLTFVAYKCPYSGETLPMQIYNQSLSSYTDGTNTFALNSVISANPSEELYVGLLITQHSSTKPSLAFVGPNVNKKSLGYRSGNGDEPNLTRTFSFYALNANDNSGNKQILTFVAYFSADNSGSPVVNAATDFAPCSIQTTQNPTLNPTQDPTLNPTQESTLNPTQDPTTQEPTWNPTQEPTFNPTADPTDHMTECDTSLNGTDSITDIYNQTLCLCEEYREVGVHIGKGFLLDHREPLTDTLQDYVKLLAEAENRTGVASDAQFLVQWNRRFKFTYQLAHNNVHNLGYSKRIWRKTCRSILIMKDKMVELAQRFN